MRCEELEAIVFSGREITAEERVEMEAHAETCEACRALMDNADALRGMQRIDEDVTPPESFTPDRTPSLASSIKSGTDHGNRDVVGENGQVRGGLVDAAEVVADLVVVGAHIKRRGGNQALGTGFLGVGYQL